MKIELEYIEKLIQLATENGLTELSVEEGEKAVIIKKEKEVFAAQTVHAAPVVATQTAAPAEAKPAVSSESQKAAPKGVAITSPMVGTFYRASSPGSAPFTDVGKTVNAGQVVCIIEAMKLMNEIEAEVSGKIVEICVQDGQPVEYGQTLMIVEP